MDFFEVLAECSIAFAGFAAIHAAISGGTGPRGSYRAWTTVASGVVVFLLALLPILLGVQMTTPSALWRVSSAFAVIAFFLYAGSIIAIDLPADQAGHPSQIPWALRSAQILQATGSTIALVNLLRPEPGPMIYGIALVVVLMSGILGLLVSFWRDVWIPAEEGPNREPRG